MTSVSPRGFSSLPIPPFMQPDLSILDAVQYDIGVPRSATRDTRGAKRKTSASTPRSVDVLSDPRGSGSSRALPLTTGDDSNAPAADTIEPAEASKKKKLKRPARTAPPPDSDDGDEDGDDGELEHESGKKRARGRPRIDVKDVTAADRRRTQIRLAQRAYRNRKERAIVSLEKKVQSLKDANEAMSNAFMRLHDFAMERGLLDTHPDFATQLRQTTEVFLEMARQSSADEDDEDDEDGSNGPLEGGSGDSATTAPATTAAPSAAPSAMPPSSAPEAVNAFEIRQRSIADAVMTFGYQTQHAQQLMVPPLPPAAHAEAHTYGGLAFQQPPSLSARSYAQTGTADGGFGVSLDALDAMTAATSAPSASGARSLFSSFGSDGTANIAGNGRSSSNSAVSLSPALGVHHSFDFTAQLGMVGSPVSPYPSYASLTLPESTSQISPHLADTHEFISTAAVGSPSTLPPPTRYPVDMSFGLRLRRQAILEAYNLINSPDPPPEEFSRVFGFCIMFEHVGQIRQRLRRGLESPIRYNSKFNKWELPYVTQTPDLEGETYALAPDRGHGPNNTSSDHRGTNVKPVIPMINVTVPGFEGAFFDCEEIELYLQQRGVHIPPNTHNVIVEVDDSDFVVAAGAASAAGGSHSSSGDSSVIDAFDAMSSPTPAPDLAASKASAAKGGGAMDWNLGGGPHILGTISAAAGRGASSGGISEQTAMMATMMNMTSFMPFHGQQQSPAAFPQRRLLTLDVDQFLQELAGRGSCLGQTPGFRQSDVNEAFWRSTQNA